MTDEVKKFIVGIMENYFNNTKYETLGIMNKIMLLIEIEGEYKVYVEPYDQYTTETLIEFVNSRLEIEIANNGEIK